VAYVAGRGTAGTLTAAPPRPMEQIELDADIKFGRSDDGTECLRGGWCPPDEGFCWSVGAESQLEISCRDTNGAHILIVQGHPFLHPPALASQRLDILVNGIELARLRFDGLFTHTMRIRNGIIEGGPAKIMFRQPDAQSPAHFGLGDTRLLAFRFWRVMLLSVGKRKRTGNPGAGAANVMNTAATSGVAAQLAALARQVPVSNDELALHARLSADSSIIPGVLDDRPFRKLFWQCLTHGYMIVASDMARRSAGWHSLSLEYDGSVGDDCATVRFTKTPGGGGIFGISPGFRGAAGRDGREQLISWRLLAILPLFMAYTRSNRTAGSCIVNLGDEGHQRGVAFCNLRSMDVLLIPDPYFVATRGYEDLKKAISMDAVPWEQRLPVALWRGSTTGYRKSADIMELPRVGLCRMAMRPENAGYLDAGITEFAQLTSDAEAETLRQSGTVRDFVPSERFQDWKYQIDIDGNTNSWPGLFQKFVSGSTVLKVDSGGPYRQWYYDRVKPFEHFVPVENDLSDLIDKIRFLRSHDEVAREIGENGRKLALSMDFEKESLLAQETIETAILIEMHS
jgi:hypothetical protein